MPLQNENLSTLIVIEVAYSLNLECPAKASFVNNEVNRLFPGIVLLGSG